jgi:hypothetical protein
MKAGCSPLLCRFHLRLEERVHLAAHDERRLLREHDVHAVGVRRYLHRHVGLLAGAGVCRGLDQVAEMIAVHVREQHRVDPAEARVVRAAHRAPGVVKDARAVGILEHQRAVERAELAVVAAERGDLDAGPLRIGRHAGARAEREAQDDNGFLHSSSSRRGRCYSSTMSNCSWL